MALQKQKLKKRAATVTLNDSSTATSANERQSENELLNSQMVSILKQNAELVKSQQFLSNCFEEMKTQMNSYFDENNKLKTELSSLTKKHSILSAEVNGLKAKFNAEEQKNLNSNVLIRGINADEDALTVVKNVAELANVEIKQGDVVSARQIHSKTKESCVMVQFAGDTKKRDFVKASKAKRLNTQMYGYTGEARPIYVDEQLTRESFLLFKRAKNLKKFGVKFVWIANGNILAREAPNEAVIHIKTMDQITEMEHAITIRDKQVKSEVKRNKREERTATNDNDTGRTHTDERAHKSVSTQLNIAKKTRKGMQQKHTTDGVATRNEKTSTIRMNTAKRNDIHKQTAITVSDDEFVDA